MRWIADSLSLLRILLTPLVIWAIVDGSYALAFWLWALAWLTDLLDGAAASRYGSISADRGIDSDGIADSVLAFFVGGAAVFVLDGAAKVVAITLLVLSIVMAGAMVLKMNKPGSRAIIAVNMIIFHGLYQVVGLSMWLGYTAYGWWMVWLLVLAFLVLAGMSQRHKVEAWYRGKFA